MARMALGQGHPVEIYKYIKYIINQKKEREKREREQKYVIDYIKLKLNIIKSIIDASIYRQAICDRQVTY